MYAKYPDSLFSEKAAFRDIMTRIGDGRRRHFPFGKSSPRRAKAAAKSGGRLVWSSSRSLADDCRPSSHYFVAIEREIFMAAPYHTRAPLCRDWMDRASTDCRLLYEIIGPRGRARAIQAPTPATNSGSNRERETEKREARADIAAVARSHAHHTERVSTHLPGSAPIHRHFPVEGKRGMDDRTPLRRWRKPRYAARRKGWRTRKPGSASIRLPPAIGEFNSPFQFAVCPR